MISEASSNSGILKDRSHCVTPSTVNLNATIITTSPNCIQLPPSSQVVQNSVLTNENVGTTSSDQQAISSMIRSLPNEDPAMRKLYTSFNLLRFRLYENLAYNYFIFFLFLRYANSNGITNAYTSNHAKCSFQKEI